MNFFNRSTRDPFGRYLAISLVAHVLLLGLLSLYWSMEKQPRVRSTDVPVQVHMKNVLKRKRTEDQPEMLGLGDPVEQPSSPTESSNQARLPTRELKQGPDNTRRKLSALPENESPGNSENSLLDSFQPEAPKATRSIQQKETPTTSDRPLKQASASNDRRLMTLGEQTTESSAKRSLENRPHFPYDRYQHLFPEERTTVTYRLIVQPSGTVSGVEVVRSSGSPRLDRELKKWIRKWSYSSSSETSRVQVEIDILEQQNHA